jgi:hypothetical protein
MPKPQPTRIPRGDELLTVNQAIELIAYGDLDRARKTQEIHISERAWSSRSVLAYMDSKVMVALWTLWRMLEDGTVEAIERDRPVPPSRWSGDRLARLAPGEELALGPFVQELQRVAAHVRIPAGEFMAALFEQVPVADVADAAPPAPALSAAESGSRGGKKSGEVRRKNRPWVPHAEELALALDPNLSNAAIATEITGGWKRQDVDPPGIRWLAEFIAELRTAGKLPQRKTRSRS